MPDIRADMEKLKLDVLGFYHLRRMQLDEQYTSLHFDAELLLVAPPKWTPEQQAEAARKLKAYEEDPDTVKCCMVYDKKNDPKKE